MIQEIGSLRKEKKLYKHKLTLLSEEAREMNDKLENLRVMPVKDKEITTLESKLRSNTEKVEQIKTKISLTKPEFDNLVTKINQKWGHLTGNISADLKETCENESLRLAKYERLLQKINHVFVETLTNHTKVFAASGDSKAPSIEFDLEAIKRRNEFARRCITGFPISWLDSYIQEKHFKDVVEKLLNKEISSPFYDM